MNSSLNVSGMLNSRVLLALVALAAVIGWGVVFFGAGSGAQMPAGSGQDEVVELTQELSALKKQYDDLLFDYEAALQEEIALRTLNESMKSDLAEPSDDASDETSSLTTNNLSLRTPGGDREQYLRTRLRHAREQLRRHRKERRQDPEKLALRSELASLQEQIEVERAYYSESLEAITIKLEEASSVSMAEAGMAEASMDEASMDEISMDEVSMGEVSMGEAAAGEPVAQDSTAQSPPTEAEQQQIELLKHEVSELQDTLDTVQRDGTQLAVAVAEMTSLDEQSQSTSTAPDADEAASEAQSVADSAEPDQQTSSTDQSAVDSMAEEAADAASMSMDASEPDQTQEVMAAAAQDESATVAAVDSASGDTATPAMQDEPDTAVSTMDSSTAGQIALLEQQLSDLQNVMEDVVQNDRELANTQKQVTELSRELGSTASENQELSEQLEALNSEIDALTVALASANQRTRNMEIMTDAVDEENRRFGQMIDQLQDVLGSTIAETQSRISIIQSEFTVIEYSSDILFESGSAVLSDPGKQILSEFSLTLEQERFANRLVSIEGHTDNVPIKGRLRALYPSNWELSLARAASATRYLVEQGLAAARIRAVGRGSSQPVASNDTESGRAANRRIEIHLVPELVTVQD